MVTIIETAEILAKINELILSLDVKIIKESLEKLENQINEFKAVGMLLNPVGAIERLEGMQGVAKKLQKILDWHSLDTVMKDNAGKFIKAKSIANLFGT